jgi:hypothetical protein
MHHESSAVIAELGWECKRASRIHVITQIRVPKTSSSEHASDGGGDTCEAGCEAGVRDIRRHVWRRE